MANKKMGRPKIHIDQTEFEKLCKLQCTKEEIAGWFNCSEDKIETWCRETYNDTFTAVFKSKSVGGKISLRRSQFKLAETSSAMAIWLGKQYLGQRDVATADESILELSKCIVSHNNEILSIKENMKNATNDRELEDYE